MKAKFKLPMALLVIVLVMVNNVEHLAWVHHSIARHWFGSTSPLNVCHSILFTLSIYYFALLFAEEQRAPRLIREIKERWYKSLKIIEQLNSELKQLKNNIDELAASLIKRDATIQQLTETLQQQQNELQQARVIIGQYKAACTCEKCGREFLTESAKRSHLGRCKGDLCKSVND